MLFFSEILLNLTDFNFFNVICVMFKIKRNQWDFFVFK